MSEIFKITVPAVPLDWTGERLTTAAESQVQTEHFHRYFLARSLCRDLDVLDVAAGEGYGSALLAQTARSVVGVELDAETIAHARRAYASSNLNFLEGDARQIPLPDHSVDMVVSFETIEHFSEHDSFLAEVRRVLRPGGRLLISSPERDCYSSVSNSANPHHVRELTGAEFLTLLQKNFSHVLVQGQRTILGSLLIADNAPTTSQKSSPLIFERHGPERFEVSQNLPRPVYLLAMASDEPIQAMPDSFFIDSGDIQGAQSAKEELWRTKVTLENELALKVAALTEMEDALVRRTAALAEIAGVRDALAGKLADATVDSNSFALQAELRLREAHSSLAALHNQARDLAEERDALGSQLAGIRNSWRFSLLATLQRNLQRLQRNLKREATNAWLVATLRRKVRFGRRPKNTSALAQTGLPANAEDEKDVLTASAKAEFLRFLASGERLVFPEVETPDVSVVIVLWNQAHLTLRCLHALLKHQGPSLEVILFDNNSRDETDTLLSRIAGVRVLRNTSNAGFLAGCNRGAEVAKGRTLLLLNSDAFLRTGSLDAALKTLESAPDIGAVGGRLILPNGRLQEAGSIIWSDASCLGYGRGLAAEAGEAMFRRNVDYCSGACLLTPRALWDRLGGFDEAYAPAYYEETDYCLRLRADGYRVVYEPALAVDHFEFGSESKQGDGVEAMTRNRNLLLSRHRETLQREHLTPGDKNVLLARSPLVPQRPRLLVIDNDVPLSASGSGYPRARSVLTAAQANGWQVTLYPLHRLEVDWKTARAEIPWEVEIATHRGPHGLGEFLQQRSGYYHAVMISRPENMAFVRGLLRKTPHLLKGARVIYDSEALVAKRDILRACLEGHPFDEAEAGARIAAELALANEADAIVCVNEAEAANFRNLGIPVHILSHSVECVSDSPSWQERSNFLFVGRLLERDSPNWKGLSWFIKKSWPLIRQTLPGATLSVVGKLDPQYEELQAPGVRLLGSFADLKPHYDAARVFIAPVHFAAGVPAKIFEATAAGLPVVGTRLMARQVSWEPGIEILAEDDAAAFAKAAVLLHQDQSTWEALRTAAQARVKIEHSPGVFRENLRELLNQGDGSTFS